MSTAADPLEELHLLVRSRHGVVALRTPEEERARSLLRHLADRLDVAFFTWSPTRGLRRDGSEDPVYGTGDALQVLSHAQSSGLDALYHLQGFGPQLSDATAARKLADAAEAFEDRPGALVLTGADLELPDPVRPRAAVLSLPPPDREELREMLMHLLRDLNERKAVEVDLSPDGIDRLLRNLQGLTLMEAEKVLTRAMVEDGRLDPDDVAGVADAKRRIVEREGLLEYHPAEEGMGQVADLDGLKGWLAKREEVIRDPERAERHGLPFPRGVLLLGVPGCGKSLSAKAVAAEWSLPLLRLDPSGLYNKYIGETEKNFRRAMETADRMSPVVLWIDEIEKALAAGGEGDGGVSRRVLGTFLSWMQDREGDVFVVATANDVERLPPEMMRKGRFDEVFFVDLPDAATRRAIFEIHLRKRGHDPAAFDLEALARATEGFSGSEIEGVVVSGLYTALAADADLSTSMLRDEASRTRPLSVVRAEEVERLRRWAEGRTVPAN